MLKYVTSIVLIGIFSYLNQLDEQASRWKNPCNTTCNVNPALINHGLLITGVPWGTLQKVTIWYLIGTPIKQPFVGLLTHGWHVGFSQHRKISKHLVWVVSIREHPWQSFNPSQTCLSSGLHHHKWIPTWCGWKYGPWLKHVETINHWVVVLTISKTMSQWEGLSPIFIMEHKKCLKPPARPVYAREISSYPHREISMLPSASKSVRFTESVIAKDRRQAWLKGYNLPMLNASFRCL